MKHRFLPVVTASILGLGAGVMNAHAQAWTSAYTSQTATGDCSALPAAIASDTSQFSIQPIINRTLFTNPQPARITKMAFWLNPTTHKADIFVGERGSNTNPASASRVLYYNASATPPTLTVIGTIPNVYVGFAEAGLWGLAVNPQTFDQDNFLYVVYSTGSSATPGATNGWRVSRFKLDPVTRMMNIASEKILMHIPAGTAGRWHTGTSMRFDNYGHLYIGMGDNEATSNGPANTADYRGGILRIKPDSTVARGYTIPEDNFGEYWAKQWENQGKPARAAAYRDTSIVKPEIYVKGSRNPYSFGIDPYRPGWLAWSECGPDRGGERGEEHNFTTKPAFSGWPFWVGAGVRQGGYASGYDEVGSDTNNRKEPSTTALWAAFNPVGMSTAIPVNNWHLNTGYDTLPPMHIPYGSQSSGCAIGGPIVRYDGRINNPGKLPPHLDNVILSFNMSQNWYGMKINPDSAKTTGTITGVLTMSKSTSTTSLRNMSEIAMGPDGVLYGVDESQTCCGSRSLNNVEGIVKLVYKGTCQDPGLFPTPVSIGPGSQLPRGARVDWLRVGASTFEITAPGAHEATILDVSGRALKSFKGTGHKTYAIPSLGTGVHVLRVKTPDGIVSRSLSAGL